MSGAIVTAPVRSPSHQVIQSEPKFDQLEALPKHKLRLPTVLLIVVQTAAATTNLKTSRARSSEGRNPKALSTRTATSVSRVFPNAIPKALKAGTGVKRLVSSAPRKIPGQTRYPSRSIAARAIPVGGQTGETFVWTEASDNPNLPATK